MLKIAAVLLFATVVTAATPPTSSNHPAPSARELGDAKQTDAKGHQSNSAGDRPSTSTAPTAIPVPPALADEQTTDETGNQNKNAGSDLGIVIPTWFLAVCTLGLFIYTAKLAGVTKCAFLETERAF